MKKQEQQPNNSLMIKKLIRHIGKPEHRKWFRLWYHSKTGLWPWGIYRAIMELPFKESPEDDIEQFQIFNELFK